MIIVDIETSGLDFNKNGIWQIGAIELENPSNFFLEEARIDDEDVANPEAMKVTGMTEEKLREPSKQSQRQLMIRFLKWANEMTVKNCVCQNPQMDMVFLEAKAKKYGLPWIFHHRNFDLHSIAAFKYFQVNGSFAFEGGYSPLSLRNILGFVGIPDERGTHNALEDAKLTAEAFSRVVYGRFLLDEFKKYPIPETIKQGEEDDYVQ